MEAGAQCGQDNDKKEKKKNFPKRKETKYQFSFEFKDDIRIMQIEILYFAAKRIIVEFKMTITTLVLYFLIGNK